MLRRVRKTATQFIHPNKKENTMPAGKGPPKPSLPQAVFTAVSAMSYDSTDDCFTSGGTDYYLFVDHDDGGDENDCQWFYGKLSQQGNHPIAHLEQATYDVISGGTYNDGAIDYDESTYKLEFQWVSGKSRNEAVAIVV